jgi:ectoine hydroxylase-related dioxygenase (phytanoyl-CoA dioxygenase family)
MNRSEMIQTRGFFVERQFLDAGEIGRLAEDYRLGSQADNQVYTLGIADRTLTERLAPRISAILDEITVPGEFTPSRVGGGAYFATANGINFPWHQDHESYFINQTHKNYVNVFIPIIKPDPARSNLKVVPADALAAMDAGLWQRLEGRGAVSAIEEDGRTRFRDDHAGGFVGEIDGSLDDIAVAPELKAGDALFMRGDLLHRTQDADTERVALSIRICDPEDRVTRAHFEQGCDVKNWYKQQNPRVYDNIANAFAAREEMSLAALLEKAYQPQ